MTEENKNDLFTFIRNEKKKPNEAEIRKAYHLFHKHVSKSIQDMYHKLKEVSDIDVVQTMCIGINMIYHIYWTLFRATFNLKLTLFLTERSVLLFTEFIIMSRSPFLNREISFIPNTNDAVLFAFKKTIGSIKITASRSKWIPLLSSNREAASSMKYIFQELLNFIIHSHTESTQVCQDECLMNNCHVDRSIENFLEVVSHLLSNPFQQLYAQQHTYLLPFLKECFSQTSSTPCDVIKMLKFILELLLELKLSPQQSHVIITHIHLLVQSCEDLVHLTLFDIKNCRRKKCYKILLKKARILVSNT